MIAAAARPAGSEREEAERKKEGWKKFECAGECEVITAEDEVRLCTSTDLKTRRGRRIRCTIPVARVSQRYQRKRMFKKSSMDKIVMESDCRRCGFGLRK